jgi:hypothetical protein
MAKVRDGFRWYWLLAPEATNAVIVVGIGLMGVLINIPVTVKTLAAIALVIGGTTANSYADRLRKRLGSEWVDRPRSWKIFWWLFIVIVVLAFILGGDRLARTLNPRPGHEMTRSSQSLHGAHGAAKWARLPAT